MDRTSYTLNVQPHSSQSGIKFASGSDNVKSISESKDNYRTVPRADQNVFLMQKRQTESQAMESAAGQSRDSETVSGELRAKIAERLNEFVDSFNKGLAFRLDEESGRDVVTIYEASTGNVIRQIPDEEMLEVLRRLEQGQSSASGLLLTKV